MQSWFNVAPPSTTSRYQFNVLCLLALPYFWRGWTTAIYIQHAFTKYPYLLREGREGDGAH